MSKEYDEATLRSMSVDDLVSLVERLQSNRIPKDFFVWLKEARGLSRADFVKLEPTQQLSVVNAHEFALSEQKRADETAANARKPPMRLPDNIAAMEDGPLKEKLTLEWINRETIRAAGYCQE